MRDELPEGWKRAELQDVCSKIQDGTHFSPRNQSSSGEFKYITAKNIRISGIDLSNVTYVSESVHRGIYKRCNPEKGDVLYIKDGATTGIATVNDLDEEFSLLSSVALLKPTRGALDSRFLKWYLNSPTGFKAMTDQMTGSAITRLILKTIRKSPIPLAPFAEQKRIAEKLEKLLAEVDHSKERIARITVLLKRFRQSVLSAACSGRLTADWRERRAADGDQPEGLPPDWKSLQVGDILESLKYGTAQKCSYEKQGVPVLRIPNVTNGVIDPSDLKYANLPAKERQHLALEIGDLLLIRSNGTVSLVGKTAVVRKDVCGFAYAGYLIRLRPDRVQVQPDYLNFALASYDVRSQIELGARSTSGVNNINSEEVSALRIFLPPLDEQAEIVRRAQALLAVANRIESRYEVAKKRIDGLAQSILSKAFRGELVPTDAELAEREGRSYESADHLLSRVHRK